MSPERSSALSAPPQRVQTSELLYLAAGSGMGSGYLEALIRVGRKIASGEPLDLGVHLLWMPAAANGVVFLLIAVALVPLVNWQPRHFTRTRLLGGFAALAALDQFLLFTPALSLVAAWLLAIGTGVQLARWSRGRAWGRGARWLTYAGLTLVLASAGGITGFRSYSYSTAARNLPQPRPGAPNILLLVLDTVREMNLSAYGYPRRTTPTLERLAERGVRFDMAVATASWTLPSHASMFTGRWQHELSADWREPLDDRYPTIAEALRKSGYATGGFVANLSYCSEEWGLNRGFIYWDAVQATFPQALRSSRLGLVVAGWRPVERFLPAAQAAWVRRPAGEINANLLRWVDGVGPRPWFAFANYFDAHRKYMMSAQFDTMFASPLPDSLTDIPGVKHPKAIQNDMRRYDQAIASIDHEIGALLDSLDRRGLLENTLVIVTADHGEEFEEHGMIGHGRTLYLPSLKVPLILSLPRWTPSGIRVSAPVSIREIAGTVLDAAGVSMPDLPGPSLSRYWTQAEPPGPELLFAGIDYARNQEPGAPVSKGDLRSVFGGAYHLIRNADRSEELYDVTADRWEQRNRTGDSLLATTAAELGAHLAPLPIFTAAVASEDRARD